MSLLGRLTAPFSSNRAETSPDADDPRLRGRTYATIPFDDVWRVSLGLVNGGLRGWQLVSANDEAGEIVAESSTRFFGFIDDVRIRIVLDEDAHTRVDMESTSRKGHADLGTNARRIAWFFEELDAGLSRLPPRLPVFATTGTGAASV